ncbi:MAG: SDR family oxidoreductase [Nitriliruptor sp.]|uniref:SDR family NAD(P)-dependent oxidoreductase n=1 Tax=Nitriliruptor sp. TaxID=2448056 RepID=UPI0034A0302F
MRTFSGRTAVVTGAGSGIGRALATELARRGAKVAASDVDIAGVEHTADHLTARGGTVRAWHLDVTDRDAVEAHAVEVVDTFGSADLVINNAGVALAARAVEQTAKEVTTVVDVDLLGVVHGTQAFLPHLLASGDGHLVNISSLFGLVAMPYNSAYNAAKFGVRGYTESIAIELAAARAPVGVTCVHPGGIATDIARNAQTTPGNEALTNAFEKALRMPPQRAAEIILRGVQRGRRRQLVGADAWAMHVAQTVLGARWMDVMGVLGRKVVPRYEP